MTIAISIETRLRRSIRVDPLTGCWNWQLSKNREGYGHFGIPTGVPGKYRICLVHRVAYETWVGAIPSGKVIDHLCFNTSCCNPQHMRVTGVVENSKRQRRILANECARGHLLTAENTFHRSGHRLCKTCNRAYHRVYRELHPDTRTWSERMAKRATP